LIMVMEYFRYKKMPGPGKRSTPTALAGRGDEGRDDDSGGSGGQQ